MADLYQIEPDLLECLIKSTIEPLRLSSSYSLATYWMTILQDRDRSQLYYCDPMLQYLSICRRILLLLDTNKVLDLEL